MTALEGDDVRTFAAPGLGDLPRDPDLDAFDADLEDERRDALDPLAALAEIAEPIDMADVIIPHRFRPGWAVQYSTVLDGDDLKRWSSRAKSGKRRTKLQAADEVDDIRFACIAMANLCRGLLRKGAPVTDGEGNALTFAHPAVWQTYNAGRAADAVRAFYGNDPYLMSTFETILAQAGVGEEVEPLDPTRPSSD